MVKAIERPESEKILLRGSNPIRKVLKKVISAREIRKVSLSFPSLKKQMSTSLFFFPHSYCPRPVFQLIRNWQAFSHYIHLGHITQRVRSWGGK